TTRRNRSWTVRFRSGTAEWLRAESLARTGSSDETACQAKHPGDIAATRLVATTQSTIARMADEHRTRSMKMFRCLGMDFREGVQRITAATGQELFHRCVKFGRSNLPSSARLAQAEAA
ncbi:MAG: hypothetical protein ACI92S_005219, partial [Planctomycetaceae bacterium]